jgi:hypothetical protein
VGYFTGLADGPWITDSESLCAAELPASPVKSCVAVTEEGDCFASMLAGSAANPAGSQVTLTPARVAKTVAAADGVAAAA